MFMFHCFICCAFCCCAALTIEHAWRIRHEMEEKYGFPCPSSLKPTNISSPEGGLNQIRDSCEIQGDIRLVPFYDIKNARDAVDKYVAELNEKKFGQLSTRGPSSYVLKHEEHGSFGAITWKWHRYVGLYSKLRFLFLGIILVLQFAIVSCTISRSLSFSFFTTPHQLFFSSSTYFLTYDQRGYEWPCL